MSNEMLVTNDIQLRQKTDCIGSLYPFKTLGDLNQIKSSLSTSRVFDAYPGISSPILQVEESNGSKPEMLLVIDELNPEFNSSNLLDEQ